MYITDDAPRHSAIGAPRKSSAKNETNRNKLAKARPPFYLSAAGGISTCLLKQYSLVGNSPLSVSAWN